MLQGVRLGQQVAVVQGAAMSGPWRVVNIRGRLITLVRADAADVDESTQVDHHDLRVW